MLKQLVKKVLAMSGYRLVKGMRQPLLDDPFETLSHLCREPAPVIFDVGAHFGFISLHLHRMFPSGTIHSFEPFPDSFRHLKANTVSVPAIRAHQLGVSDAVGTRELCVNKSSATNSLMETDPEGPRTWGEGLVETVDRVTAQFTTLDAFLAAEGIDTVDILKLDVQGAEPLVMRGAAEALAAGKVRFILAEIITQPTYVGQQSLLDALTMYTTAGFRLHNIYGLSHTKDGRLSQIDAIFVHERAV